jgi:DNA-binding NarL/FixJ family response regulator
LLEALAAALGATRQDARSEPLTPRENEVLLCLSEGKNYGQIAAELVIELETVRTHARRVRRKLGVATSRELHGCSVPVRFDDGDVPMPGSCALEITP